MFFYENFIVFFSLYLCKCLLFVSPELSSVRDYVITHSVRSMYRIVSNKRPGGVAIFQKGDFCKRQVFNAKMQCLSLFTMTRHREI